MQGYQAKSIRNHRLQILHYTLRIQSIDFTEKWYQRSHMLKLFTHSAPFPV